METNYKRLEEKDRQSLRSYMHFLEEERGRDSRLAQQSVIEGIRQFVSLIERLFPLAKVALEGIIKRGVLMTRSQFLLVWRQRELELNF